MKFTSWDNTREIELSPCPFCGGEPVVKHIGNDYVKKRSIKVRCSKCRVERTDAALRHGFEWLENIAAENWNQRPTTAEEQPQPCCWDHDYVSIASGIRCARCGKWYTEDSANPPPNSDGGETLGGPNEM